MFEDGYYFGQGKLICLAETDSDNGKLVTVKNEANTRTWTAHIADKKCEFILPPKDRYSIELGEGEYITKVDMSYGACIGVHLADGYGNVIYNDLLTLEEITAATDLSFKGASAESVSELNSKLPFSFAIDSSGNYGYKKVGADAVIPFKKGTFDGDIKIINKTMSNDSWYTVTFPEAPKRFILHGSNITATNKLPLLAGVSASLCMYDVQQDTVVLATSGFEKYIEKISDTQYKMKSYTSSSRTYNIIYS